MPTTEPATDRPAGEGGSVAPAGADRKTLALASLLPRATRALVVGCGDGREAGVLARQLGCPTVGIDIGADFAFDTDRAAPARLMTMDARALAFADRSFDLVYSFHALEHIPEPMTALAEMRRVLMPGGRYLVGTPNRDRLVGYVGSVAPLRDRIAWNLADLGDRVRGRWSNEAGAHAGFSRHELAAMCRRAFGGKPVDVTDRYYDALYPTHAQALTALRRARLTQRVYPCVYVAGRIGDEVDRSRD